MKPKTTYPTYPKSVRIGTELKALRLARGLSGHKVAKQAGITRKTLIFYEEGRVEQTKIEIISSIISACKTLGVQKCVICFSPLTNSRDLKCCSIKCKKLNQRELARRWRKRYPEKAKKHDKQTVAARRARRLAFTEEELRLHKEKKNSYYRKHREKRIKQQFASDLTRFIQQLNAQGEQNG